MNPINIEHLTAGQKIVLFHALAESLLQGTNKAEKATQLIDIVKEKVA